MDDEIILTGPNVIDISGGNMDYRASLWSPISSAMVDTFTIDPSSWNQNVTITSGAYDPSVRLNNAGINMDTDCDIKIGDRSLKEFMDKVEERLNILRPNPKLEDKWDELAELGKRYRELESTILEKEKLWKILKDE
jgi:hypothetical protein